MARTGGRALLAGCAPSVPRLRTGWREKLDSPSAPGMGGAMAPAMTPPAHAPEFLASCGWEGAEVSPLAGDASFRRYFRVVQGDRSAVLMDAPPPHEDPRPFVAVAEWVAPGVSGAPL